MLGPFKIILLELYFFKQKGARVSELPGCLFEWRPTLSSCVTLGGRNFTSLGLDFLIWEMGQRSHFLSGKGVRGG